ncbi:MAG: glycoside hydrolase family 2 protein [Ornithinimicrobium sp.]
MNADAAVVPVRTRVLDHDWTVEWVDGPADTPQEIRGRAVAATVPGQIHTDLMAAGLLSDPDVGFGECEQHWIGASTWRWRTAVTIDRGPGEHCDLVAHGLDTIAEVRLGDTLLGRTDDQHLRYRWTVQPPSDGEPVELSVTIHPIHLAAAAAEEEVGHLPRPYPFPYPYVRKSACNFGWDWGPSYVTAGIWRPIELQTFGRARLDDLRILADLSDEGQGQRGHIGVHASLATPATTDPAVLDAVGITVLVTDTDGQTVARGESLAEETSSGGTQAVVQLSIDEPRLWQPVGYGEQPMYEVQVQLVVDDVVVETTTRHTGLRTVRIEEPQDELGRRWHLHLNGRRVRVRGYNWIPDDPFIAEVTPARVRHRLDQAVAGGANLIRVWGGGYIVDHEFMRACDERGLLVWHDFLFACAAYDESPEMVAKITAEAEQAVTALSSHPSLVIWCGGNECVWGWHSWGWQDELEGRSWGARIYGEVLPEVVARLDPTRPYVGNSPWSGSVDLDPSDPASGPVHVWNVWNDVDYKHYRSVDPVFVSEMGWCGPPAWTTLRGAVPEGPLDLDNPGVRHHLRAEDGVLKLDRGLQQNFGATRDPDDWHYLSQLLQARSQQAGSEWLRSRERCAGVVVWQLNDCWPVVSWAAVDGQGHAKPLWFALRRAFAPRLLTLQPLYVADEFGGNPPGDVAVVMVNDSLEDWRNQVSVRRVDLHGTELARTDVVLEVRAGQTANVPLDPSMTMPDNPTQELLVAEDTDGRRTWWAFAKDVEMTLPTPRFDVQVHDVSQDSVTVEITAASLLRDLIIYPDRAAYELSLDPSGAQVDEMLLSVFPGERATLTLTGLPGVDLVDRERVAAVLSTAPVLRVVGDG